MDPQTLINTLVGGVNAFSLYPPGHPSVRQAVANAFRQLAARLEQTGAQSVKIASVEEILVIDEEPLYDSNKSNTKLMELIAERGFDHIAFDAAIEEPEFERFLHLFSQPANLLDTPQARAASLRDNDLRHISLGDVQVEEVTEDRREAVGKVYAKAHDVLRSAWEETRMGNIPGSDAAYGVIHDLSETLLSDGDTLIGLMMLKNYDEYTFTHSVNVGILSLALARQLGYEEPELSEIGLAGFLHDIGKCRMPLEVLHKPAKLDEEEWRMMTKHPITGYEIIQQMERVTATCYAGVRHHHTRHDRKGYPALDNDAEMPVAAEIIAIVDCYDAMTTQRQYQKRFDPREALEIMVQKLSGSSLNPHYLQEFIRMLGIYPIGSVVRLDTGWVALVTGRASDDDPMRPTVKVVYDAYGAPFDPPMEIDLAADPEPGEEPVSIVTEIALSSTTLDLEEHL